MPWPSQSDPCASLWSHVTILSSPTVFLQHGQLQFLAYSELFPHSGSSFIAVPSTWRAFVSPLCLVCSFSSLNFQIKWYFLLGILHCPTPTEIMPSSLCFLHRLIITRKDVFSLCFYSFNVCLFCNIVSFMMVGTLPTMFMVMGPELRTMPDSLHPQDKFVGWVKQYLDKAQWENQYWARIP